jgi:hypothetical protein
MNRFLQGLWAVAAVTVSLAAHAQLTSVDGGAAAVDSNGLMWANTLGAQNSESGPLFWSPSGAAGSAQAWVAGLDASDYGGYSDWSLATGNGTVGANTTTNQISELFNVDCGNLTGTATKFGKPGKSCGALSAVVNAHPMSDIFTSSLFLTSTAIPCSDPSHCFYAYDTASSSSRFWTGDTNYSVYSGEGYALAVRKVSAPEVDPKSAVAAFALLLGGLMVVRGRKNVGLRHRNEAISIS